MCPRRKCLRVRFEHFTIDFRICNFPPNKNLFTLITFNFIVFICQFLRSFVAIQERHRRSKIQFRHSADKKRKYGMQEIVPSLFSNSQIRHFT